MFLFTQLNMCILHLFHTNFFFKYITALSNIFRSALCSLSIFSLRFDIFKPRFYSRCVRFALALRLSASVGFSPSSSASLSVSTSFPVFVFVFSTSSLKVWITSAFSVSVLRLMRAQQVGEAFEYFIISVNLLPHLYFLWFLFL